MKGSGQTVRFFILLTLLLIAGFSATSWISYRVSYQTLRNQIITNELPLTSDNIYSEIQRDLLSPVFIASLMANDSFLRNWVINGEKDPEHMMNNINHPDQRGSELFADVLSALFPEK